MPLFIGKKGFSSSVVLTLWGCCSFQLRHLMNKREPAAVAVTIFSSLFCYWCIYTWFLSTIMRIILTNHTENRPFRIQFILTKCLRKITLFLSMLNYSSFSLILIKFLRVGIFSKNWFSLTEKSHPHKWRKCLLNLIGIIFSFGAQFSIRIWSPQRLDQGLQFFLIGLFSFTLEYVENSGL